MVIPSDVLVACKKVTDEVAKKLASDIESSDYLAVNRAKEAFPAVVVTPQKRSSIRYA